MRRPVSVKLVLVGFGLPFVVSLPPQLPTIATLPSAFLVSDLVRSVLEVLGDVEQCGDFFTAPDYG